MYKRALWRITTKIFKSDKNSLVFTLTLLIFINKTNCQNIH